MDSGKLPTIYNSGVHQTFLLCLKRTEPFFTVEYLDFHALFLLPRNTMGKVVGVVSVNIP